MSSKHDAGGVKIVVNDGGKGEVRLTVHGAGVIVTAFKVAVGLGKGRTVPVGARKSGSGTTMLFSGLNDLLFDGKVSLDWN